MVCSEAHRHDVLEACGPARTPLRASAGSRSARGSRSSCRAAVRGPSVALFGALVLLALSSRSRPLSISSRSLRRLSRYSRSFSISASVSPGSRAESRMRSNSAARCSRRRASPSSAVGAPAARSWSSVRRAASRDSISSRRIRSISPASCSASARARSETSRSTFFEQLGELLEEVAASPRSLIAWPRTAAAGRLRPCRRRRRKTRRRARRRRGHVRRALHHRRAQRDLEQWRVRASPVVSTALSASRVSAVETRMPLRLQQCRRTRRSRTFHRSRPADRPQCSTSLVAAGRPARPRRASPSLGLLALEVGGQLLLGLAQVALVLGDRRQRVARRARRRGLRRS